MSQSLPGILRISTLRCDALPPHLARRAAAGIPIHIVLPTTDVEFTDVPVCEVSTEYDNRATLQTATLSFTTVGLIDDSAPLAFVITTAQGGTFLIGGREQPFPVIKQKLSTGTPSGASATNSVEVSLTAPLALISCTL